MNTTTPTDPVNNFFEVLCNGSMNALASLITARPDYESMDLGRLCEILRKVLKAEIPRFLELDAKDLVDCANENLIRAAVAASCGAWASEALSEYLRERE